MAIDQHGSRVEDQEGAPSKDQGEDIVEEEMAEVDGIEAGSRVGSQDSCRRIVDEICETRKPEDVVDSGPSPGVPRLPP